MFQHHILFDRDRESYVFGRLRMLADCAMQARAGVSLQAQRQ